MKELFDLLAGTTDMINVEIHAGGFTSSLNTYIISTEKYTDGLKVYIENESDFFISSLLDEIIEKESDEMFYTYYIQTALKAVIILKIPR